MSVRDEAFQSWLREREEARDARRTSFDDAWFPKLDITRDERFARRRIEQAKAWVVDDYWGHAPQDPHDIMADLLVLLDAYRTAGS